MHASNGHDRSNITRICLRPCKFEGKNEKMSRTPTRYEKHECVDTGRRRMIRLLFEESSWVSYQYPQCLYCSAPAHNISQRFPHKRICADGCAWGSSHNLLGDATKLWWSGTATRCSHIVPHGRASGIKKKRRRRLMCCRPRHGNFWSPHWRSRRTSFHLDGDGASVKAIPSVNI